MHLKRTNLLLIVFFSTILLESCSCPLHGENQTVIHIFVSYGCESCIRTLNWIQKYNNSNSIVIYVYDIYDDEDLQLLKKLASALNVSLNDIPILFINMTCLQGESEIKREFPNLLEKCISGGCIDPLTLIREDNVEKSSVNLPILLVAAASDSINPCALSVLLFLLMYISTLGSGRRLLKVGLAYILMVYITYLLAGIGIFTTVRTIGFANLFHTASAVILVLVGVLSLKDFFYYGKWLSLHIPKGTQDIISTFVKAATLPSAIILGFIVSLFELPCTGGVYLAVLAMLSKSATMLEGVAYLMLYNIIFVLPLLLLLLFVYYGSSAERFEEWRDRHKASIRLLEGLIFLSIGVLMLMGYV